MANRKKEKTCVECGRPVPAGRNASTCSEACRAAREKRKRQESSARVKLKKAEASPVKSGMRRWGAPTMPGTRKCAGGCGREITDYRCPECWARLRAEHGLGEHPDEGGIEDHVSWFHR